MVSSGNLSWIIRWTTKLLIPGEIPVSTVLRGPPLSGVNALQQFTTRKVTGPLPRAREAHWTSHRENAESFHDSAGMGLGWDMGGAFEGPWSKTTDGLAPTPFGSALHSGVIKKKKKQPLNNSTHLGGVPTDLIPGLHPNTNRAVLIHPASVVGRNLEQFRAGGWGVGMGEGKRFGKGFLPENFHFQHFRQ